MFGSSFIALMSKETSFYSDFQREIQSSILSRFIENCERSKKVNKVNGVTNHSDVSKESKYRVAFGVVNERNRIQRLFILPSTE